MDSGSQVIPACSPLWNKFLALVPHDFFHTAEYHAFSAATGGGEALLLVYGSTGKFVAWPCLLRAVDHLTGEAPEFRDVTSVYGYSGPIAYNCQNDYLFLSNAWRFFLEIWRARSVVSVFTRFHPIVGNHAFVSATSNTDRKIAGRVYREGKSVMIDLTRPPEAVWAGYKRTLRQAIRNAESRGNLTIVSDPEWEHLEAFLSVYHATMHRNEAAQFYFFSYSYLIDLKKALGPQGSLFLCMRGDLIAAGCLLIESQEIATVHLAASDEKFFHLSPTKLLFHEVQLFARSRGNKVLHLGGGRGSRDDDALFRFKALFSDTHLPFYTGRWILDSSAYDRFAAETRKVAEMNDQILSPGYFPLYRAPLRNPNTSSDLSRGSVVPRDSNDLS